MPALPDGKRKELWAEYMDRCTKAGIRIGTGKTNVRAAANALDNFFVANATAINQAIPQPARTEMTPEAKAILAAMLLEKRYVEGA